MLKFNAKALIIFLFLFGIYPFHCSFAEDVKNEKEKIERPRKNFSSPALEPQARFPTATPPSALPQTPKQDRQFISPPSQQIPHNPYPIPPSVIAPPPQTQPRNQRGNLQAQSPYIDNHHPFNPAFSERNHDHFNDYPQERHDFRNHRPIRSLDFTILLNEERVIWQNGYWYNGYHHGLYGWWWIADGYWYYYDQPYYPMPQSISPRYYEERETPQFIPLPGASLFYHCRNPEGIYPNVEVCSVPFDPVYYYCDQASGYYPVIQTCPMPFRLVDAPQASQ